MSLEIGSTYLCVYVCVHVPKIQREICMVLIPSYTTSRVMSGRPLIRAAT